MFTGIVQESAEIVDVDTSGGGRHVTIALSHEVSAGLEVGGSVAIDGVCLTVVSLGASSVRFDAVGATLECTTIPTLRVGSRVNVERSMRVGSEIGGHEVSGHVDCVGQIVSVQPYEGSRMVELRVPPNDMRYVFRKGFVAVNGVSLTISEIAPEPNTFRLWLIPETLRTTNLGALTAGTSVNIEYHKGVQVLVDTIERALVKLLAGGRYTEEVRQIASATGLLSGGVGGGGKKKEV